MLVKEKYDGSKKLQNISGCLLVLGIQFQQQGKYVELTTLGRSLVRHTAWRPRYRQARARNLAHGERFRSGKCRTWHSRQSRSTWVSFGLMNARIPFSYMGLGLGLVV